MAENLAVTKYNDGEEISLVVDNWVWQDTISSDGFYSWYDNTEAKYGALYNWRAVSSGKLCPAGWRVPTEEDWTILIDHLGGREIAGGKLKEAGSVHWTRPNVGATNSSGFTALPGGYRWHGGNFNNVKRSGSWWTSTSNYSGSGVAYSLHSGHTEIEPHNYLFRIGASVRCIKEE